MTNEILKYRERIYRKYSTNVQRISAVPGDSEIDRWGLPYDSYFRGWLPEDKKAPIADIGCGFGRLLRFFTKRGYVNVRGVDISPEQVELARRIISSVELGDVIEFLRNHENEFALITALDIVEHFTKAEVLTFLDACRAALRPGGALILQTPNADSPWSFAIRYGDFTHEICYGPQVLRTLVEIGGFGHFEAREEGPVPHGFVSLVRAALWRFLRAGVMFRNMVETGSAGSGIYTRVFIARCLRI
jgi:2-polyprenyl-3-methyl-5-hydroxy-6-metoxy-1,4-benzoquinol methylase